MKLDSFPKTPTYLFGQRRFPFRWKITLPFVALSIWLIVAGALFATQLLYENAEERFDNQLLEGSKIAVEWMVQEESALLEGLRSLAFTSGVAEAVLAGDTETLRSLSFPIVLNNQIDAVEYLDRQGKLIFSMRRQPGEALEAYNFVQDGSEEFGELGFVQKALSAVVDNRGDKYAGLVPGTGEVTFYIAGPVYDAQGQVVGGILVGTYLETILSRMQNHTLARITFYSPDGAALASSFVEAVRLDRVISDQVLRQENPSSHKRELRILETNFVEIVTPWTARSEDLGLLGVTYSTPVFVNASIPTRIGMFVFVLVFFVLIIVIGLVIANSVTRPLTHLTNASHEVSKGNLQIHVPPPASNDELTDLTYMFNSMISNLNLAQAEILDAYDSTLAGWSLALEMREKETASHGQRVTGLTVRLAQEMGYQGDELVQIRRGALLHDIGKIGIPDAILNKPGRLTEEEFSIMKRHPGYAWEFFSKIQYLRPALDIPYCHHEKWDGTGYPRGLKGEEIPLAARIFAVVDVWDAITNDRVYRKAMPWDEALQVIEQGRGSHFDPIVVDTFLKLLTETSPLLVSSSDLYTQVMFEEALAAQSA